MARADHQNWSSLAPAEQRVLRLIAQGLTSKEIASRLDLSTCTVASHRKSIARKLGAHSTAALAVCGAALLQASPAPNLYPLISP